MDRRSFLGHSVGALALLAAHERLVAEGRPAPPGTVTPAAPTGAGRAPVHTDVWREAGRYGGWPANHGMWGWGDELLVGFTAGVLKTGDPMRHPIDRSAGEQHVLARSLDGGRTWHVEVPAALQPPPRPERRAVTGEALRLPVPRIVDSPIDFTTPDLAITFRAAHKTAGAWMFASRNRGRDWEGPFTVPALDTPGLDPRTDYVVLGRHELLVFQTALKRDGKEGRPLTLRTRDGGRTWERLGWMGPETDGFRIMPATVALGQDPSRLYTVIRRRDDTRHSLEGFRSPDGGASWQPTGTVVADTGRGNPASVARLADGRLCCVYGFRAAPFGIRFVLSIDEGATWSAPRTLRADGSDWDLGYPRTIVRADGRLVTVYYYNDARGPERYIGASIWHPDDVGRATSDASPPIALAPIALPPIA